MAFTEEDINQIKTNAKDWELEDGFACSHRRQKQYFVQPANKKEKIIAATEIGTEVHDGMTAAVPNESIEKPKPTKVSVQIEDYGGGIAVPHYGVRRPSSDYYNSNLILLEKKMLKLEVKGPSEKQQKA